MKYKNAYILEDAMGLLTVKEAGKKWGISSRMVTVYCDNNRIPGAFKKGNLWLIPENVEKPQDKRRKRKESYHAV